MIDEQNVFDQPVKNSIKTYNNILTITTGQGDGYTTGCLLFTHSSMNIIRKYQ